MYSVNKVTLLGNVGQDAEIKSLANDSRIATFSVATTESYKKGDEWNQKTQWHNCTAWNGLASIAEKHLRKGSKVYLEGKIENDSYTDKDGVIRYTSKVIVDQLILIENKNQ